MKGKYPTFVLISQFYTKMLCRRKNFNYIFGRRRSVSFYCVQKNIMFDYQKKDFLA